MKRQNIYDGLWNKVRYRRIGCNSLCFLDDQYSYYLRFEVWAQFNNLNPQHNTSKHSKAQEETNSPIKSGKDGGIRSREGAYYLNESDITSVVDAS